VGIGTTLPSTLLHVNGVGTFSSTTDPQLVVNNSSAGVGAATLKLTNAGTTYGSTVSVNANGELVLTNADSGSVGFNVNASRKMTILSSGNVVLVQIILGLLWK
jgi:hypothetical protein